MKKIIILSGAEATGKSRLALDIHNKTKETSVYIDGATLFRKNKRGRNIANGNFPFGNCSERTKIIIIDELLDFESNKYFFAMAAANGVFVEKIGKDPVLIYPKIILITNDIKEPQGAFYLRRFKILKFPRPKLTNIWEGIVLW